MNVNLALVFAVLLFAGILAPAYAASTDHVVINEVDINPPGDDSKSVSEWIEIYNPTDSDVDLSGWEIASTTILKKTMTIPSGIVIEPGQFLTYSYQSIWFTDSNESVELRDDNGIVIDKTPLLADIKNDFTSWQRLYDGYDFDSSNDWKFVTSTSGLSNGKLITIQDSKEIIVTVSPDKDSYLFGETATISGSVSEEVGTVLPAFVPEPIAMTITGPNFNKILTFYPDFNLNYKTTVKLDQVLGINEGTYDVSVNYGGASDNTSFSVGFELVNPEEKIDGSLSVLTDKSQYIPGQIVSITGLVTDVILFEGIKFSVTNSQGVAISNGNLFPSDGKFKTSLFLTTVNPDFGTYEIIVEYFDRATSTTFEVTADVKESVPISLWTDKEVYGVGDTVNITGRLNNLWTESLDLKIIQTKSLSLGTDGGSVLKILDAVRLDGAGKFEYSFVIPNSDTRLGHYTIEVSKDVGSVIKFIKVVENPETYVVNTDPLVVNTDKFTYDFNLDKQVTISGQILDPVVRTSSEVAVVKVVIETEDGSPLEIIGLPEGGKRLSTSGITVGYEFTAIPEASGFYSVNVGLERLIFSEGKYVVKAKYEEYYATTIFEINDLLSLGDLTIFASLDKSVYGLGEPVHLSGTFGSQSGDSQGITMTLYKPGGDIDKSGTIIDGGFFSWDWTTPVYEKTIVINRDRSITPTNLGIYKINLDTEGNSLDLFFKVSLTPEDDELVVPTLSVSTSKSLYKSGEKLFVEGTVNKRSQVGGGLAIPQRATIQIIDGTFPFKQIMESSVYPDVGGFFASSFELPLTIFSEGEYKVKVFYDGEKAENIFSVANDLVISLDEDVTLLVSTDSSEYHPGDIVTVSGKPNKLIYLEGFDVSVIQKSDAEITCGSFVCGTHLGPVTLISPSPTGSFTHQFTIPDSASSIGTYEITVDADFETKHIQFNVVSPPKLNTVIEKENRITEKEISILTEEKNIQNGSFAPRVISGSLITTTKGDDSSVNLRVSTITGTCIIGSDADCLVHESTRKQGQIYDVVEVDGISLNVRYSGPDTRLEKFSILPESSTAFLPDTNWNVEVIKDDQVSRFYYKVTYKTLE